MKRAGITIGAAVGALALSSVCWAGLNVRNEVFSQNNERGMASRAAYQSLSFDQKLNALGGITFSLSRDSRTRMSYRGTDVTSSSRQFKLQSAPGKKLGFSAERSSSDNGQGMTVATQSVGFTANPFSKLNLAMNMSTRRMNRSQQSETSYSMNYPLGRRMNFSARTASTTSERRRTVTNTVYLMDGSLPDRPGLAKNIRFIINKSGDKDTAAAVRFDRSLFGGNLSCEFADRGGVGWSGTYKNVMRYTTAVGPSNKVKIDFSSKKRTREVGGIDAVLTSQSLKCPVGKSASFEAELYKNREAPGGGVNPMKGLEIAFNTGLKNLQVGAMFRTEQNIFTHADHVVKGLNVATKAANGGKINAGVSSDAGIGSSTWTYTVKYDRPVSEEEFVTLSSEYRTVNDRAPGSHEALQIWLDLHHRASL